MTIGVRLLPARAPLYDLTAGANQNTYITELWLTGESNIVGLPADRAFERIATMDRTQSATLQRSHRRIQNTQPGSAAGPRTTRSRWSCCNCSATGASTAPRRRRAWCWPAATC
ncbi:MAG: hypothetical protein R2838_06440 [Caldilineaceae bacterium]